MCSSKFKSMICCFAFTGSAYRFPPLLFVWQKFERFLICICNANQNSPHVLMAYIFLHVLLNNDWTQLLLFIFRLRACRFFIIGLLPLKITRPFICKAFRGCQQPIQEPTALARFLFKGQSEVTCHLVDAFCPIWFVYKVYFIKCCAYYIAVLQKRLAVRDVGRLQ